MQQQQYTFNGTGAAVYLSLGFIPDEVEVIAWGDAELAKAFWNVGARVAASDNGFMEHGGDQTTTLYTAGTGIEPYEGGEVLSSAMQTDVTYGGGVYLGVDRQNYSRNAAYGYASNPLTAWTLTTAGNRTGKFNDDVPASGTTRIGPGSRIQIRETVGQKVKWAVIEALTAGQGVADDEVTLSRAVKSGEILYISGMYDLAPIAVGKTTGAGIKLNITADVNVNDQIQSVVARTYDNS